ncbi:MAG: tRNA (adenosine(37)-N6)-threonylcarbamoyltransferase complex dimerization subunit type 1 TsaB [Clostridia bacterium]|nr:tRNA (adenosine(37)-N6)-threonylcarbamoyltransferase complex dimerization subunit type 1 TsaB [Clostridia bacterium]
MKILAIDSSAVSCSVAISEDEHILASAFVNNGLTHSQTLLPMVERVCLEAGCPVGEIDLFAVTNGPGSFTGVRIGVAALKGMAFAADKPCIGISTLEVIAANVQQEGCIALACMDARRNQVYTATFESGTLKRLSEDEAAAVESMAPRIQAYDKKVYVCGDGAKLAYDILKTKCSNVYLPQEDEIYQNAEMLCILAYRQRDKAVPGSQLVPTYLRMSQAERELKKKGKKQ